MIFGKEENYKAYGAANEKFVKGFEFIKKAVSENLPEGKYEIDGDRLYAVVQSYTTKYATDALFEGHKKYIDIQYIADGIEEIGVVDISKAKVEKPYSDEIDAAFYGKTDNASRLVLEKGDFAIFYPCDLHMPGLCRDGKPSDVRKIIIKVGI